MAKKKVTLLIISRNKIEGFKVVGPRIDKSLFEQVLVVDGGSTDGTIEYCRSLGFEVIVQDQPGILEGIQQGIDAARGEYICFFTPDNNCIPERLPEVIQKVEEGYDMICVSRYKDGAKSEDDSLISGFGNWMFTTMVNVLFRTEYTDVLNFYRCIRKSLLQELGIDIRFSISTLLSIRSKLEGIKWIDIPGDEPARVGGASSRSIIRHGTIELMTILGEYAKYKRNPKYVALERQKMMSKSAESASTAEPRSV